MSAHKKADGVDLYSQDFFAWASEQAALLRSGRVSELDLENMAEEIESLGKGERRELESRLTVLLLHLLKWQFQSELRGRSWDLTITEQRRRIVRHLNANPSLVRWKFEAMADAYETAVIRAEGETGMLRDMFPWSCPYSFEQAVEDTFWPEPP